MMWKIQKRGSWRGGEGLRIEAANAAPSFQPIPLSGGQPLNTSFDGEKGTFETSGVQLASQSMVMVRHDLDRAFGATTIPLGR